MTTDEIRALVHEIEDMCGDDEAAHAAEDQLYIDFIKYVSTFDNPLGAKAKEVLKASEIKFMRWCA